MCCIAELAMFAFGLFALIKGQFSLTGSRVVEAVPARIIGIILLLPLLIGQGSGLIIGVVKGVQMGSQGKEFTMQDAMSLQGPLLAINGGVTALCFVAVLIIGIVAAKPVKSKRRRVPDEVDELEEDRPRRRRQRDEYDEDEPRRRPEPDDQIRG